VLNFQTLYKGSCSGCHGDDGRNGAALPLNNPAFLAVAGADNLRSVTARGMSATLMPAFARSAGGMLTDEQIDALVRGMLQNWGRPQEFAQVSLPPYSSNSVGNAADGEKVYALACARCHGADGTGVKTPAQRGSSVNSIVDPSYLALVNDQSLRSFVIAGHTGEDAPDWRTYTSGLGNRSLTSQEISDVVAWVAKHRASDLDPSVLVPGGKSADDSGKETK
jgi:cytochrome c oxidase cbb3-type subunit 3/ubiquinol-cytochrome c reductase cytochrome c subunit